MQNVFLESFASRSSAAAASFQTNGIAFFSIPLRRRFRIRLPHEDIVLDFRLASDPRRGSMNAG